MKSWAQQEQIQTAPKWELLPTTRLELLIKADSGSQAHLPFATDTLTAQCDRSRALQATGITKRSLGVLANDHVKFSLKRGEFYALLGENRR